MIDIFEELLQIMIKLDFQVCPPVLFGKFGTIQFGAIGSEAVQTFGGFQARLT
jgi:hypothetical protein